MMGVMEPWTFADREKLNREHPRSFFIPSRERRDRLVVGEDVKLAFETSDGRSERMWVTITGAEPPRFLGILANVPSIIDLAVGAPGCVRGPPRHRHPRGSRDAWVPAG